LPHDGVYVRDGDERVDISVGCLSSFDLRDATDKHTVGFTSEVGDPLVDEGGGLHGFGRK